MKKLAGLLVVALVLGSAAFLAYRIYKGRPQVDRAALLAPSDSYFYGTLYLDPSNDQKRAFRDFLSYFPGTGTADEAADALARLLEGPLDTLGLDYVVDVDPWLGDQVAFFAAPGASGETAAALMFATKDADAAEEAANKAFRESALEGSTFVVTDDFLVVGDEEAVEAVSQKADDEPGLGDTEEYEGATEAIADDRIALLFTNVKGLVGLTGPAGTLPDAAILQSLGMDLDTPSATVITMQDDALIMESKAGAPLAGALGPIVLGDGSNDLIPDLPSTAWIALGVSDLGATLSEYLEVASQLGVTGLSDGLENLIGLDLETEVLPWMGDGAAFLEGEGFLTATGGMVVESTDPAASLEAVAAMSEHLAAGGGDVEAIEKGDLAGFSLQFPGLPSAFNVLGGDRFIAAYGGKVTGSLVEVRIPLSANETFMRALEDLGDGFSPTFFLDLETAVGLFEDARETFGGGLPESYERNVQPWLKPVLHITIGARRDGDVIVQRTAIGVS